MTKRTKAAARQQADNEQPQTAEGFDPRKFWEVERPAADTARPAADNEEPWPGVLIGEITLKSFRAHVVAWRRRYIECEGACFNLALKLHDLWNYARRIEGMPPPPPLPNEAVGGNMNAKDPALFQVALGALDSLLRWCDEAERAAAPGAPQAGAGAAPPAKILVSWGDILEALGLKKKDREKVSRLNRTRGGPIKPGTRGQQPIVAYPELLAWWNRLTIEYEVGENRTRDAKPTTAESYMHGRNGVAIPDIGGGERRRRADRRP